MTEKRYREIIAVPYRFKNIYSETEKSVEIYMLSKTIQEVIYTLFY